MSTLLEIVGDDIAALEDDDLRALIGLLCEADYRLAGLPTKGITWGGHQDARDGGLDVVVRDKVLPPSTSVVSRSTTGFQVKKPDMPRGEILKEMRPGNVLRPSIKALIEEKGAYIIVSSSGSVADSALGNRKNAMAEALAGEDNHEDLYLDFLDRGRVATWVRCHPSLVLWVRNRIGNPIKGWRSYENWANAPGGLEEEYLLDDELRLRDWENPGDKGQSVTEGLARLRSVLSRPGNSVRLTGLSGVGKTRFVQALFDARVAEQSLNPYQAVYADISDGPEPDPLTLANQLFNDRSPAVLIVDNCPPDLHRRLTQVCSRAHSTVSVLTVEYDVRDDIPEERTNIYRLDPASEELIEKLIRKRFDHIGQVDARTIAEFAGGNSRVAIALANTVQRGETLSDFRSEELFERLFWQRHDRNESLLTSAQICALVYSFHGEDATSEASELALLGSLVDKTGQDLYRDVAALKQRDLVQSRGVWRAVLPHAIANRLAKQALEQIPKETLVDSFLTRSSERLIRSFSRRLSYLHDSESAVSIVETWLEPQGWIGKVINNLNGFGADVLQNISPVSPEATLSAIERAANGIDGATFASRKNTHHTMFVRLLRHLAYDPVLFERSTNLIVRFALTEDPDERNNSIRSALQSLFYIQLSGTHAPIEARAAIVRELLDSDELAVQELGLFLLDAALETWHFSASHEFEFGAHPRDYGYYPATREEVVLWFGTFIDICTRLALSAKPLAERVKGLLANKLRGLWTKGGMLEEIEKSAESLLQHGAWNDGWIALRGIIRFDSKDLDQENKERLFALEKILKPKDLLENARAFALSDQRASFVLEDGFDDDAPASDAYQKVADSTEEIGTEVGSNPGVFQELLPALVSTQNTRLFSFGRGLAAGCPEKGQCFNALRNAFGETDREQRQTSVILGFLSYLSETDLPLYNAILDGCIDDVILGEYFPILQTTSTIDQQGVQRLHAALGLEKAPVNTFQYLAWGRVHESIDDVSLADLLEKIVCKDGGIGVAVEILNMRFHRSQEAPHEYSDALIGIARKVLTTHPFDKQRRRQGVEDYALASIAAVCLRQEDGAAAANEFCKNLADAIFAHQTYSFDSIRVLNALAELQPKAFLDEFMGRDDVEAYQRRRLFSDDFERRENPMSKIADDVLIRWCEQGPPSRFAAVISAVETFEKSNRADKYEWRPIVDRVLRRAPELDGVLDQLGRTLRPSSWSGSLADILEHRSVLLRNLYGHDNAEVASWAKSQYALLQEGIAREREREKKHERDRDESFE